MPQESQATTSSSPGGFQVKRAIRDVIEEFRRIGKALQEYPMDKQSKIDTEKLLTADSTEQALREQNILGDAEIAFLSALATAESESDRISRAASAPSPLPEDKLSIE